jgi:sodium transport system ATP-binding protein
MTMAMIEARGLTRRFGDFTAVEGLSLEVGEGELVGLLGANGAGKTTLLRMLAGMLTPCAGEASVGGFNPAAHRPEAKAMLGYVTADTALPSRLTPREVLRLFGGLHQLPAQVLGRRFEEVVGAMALAPFLDRPCGALSSGQQQRASLARALIHDPSALILDEPTSALDALASRWVLEAIDGARSRGKAVLLSTHMLSDAERVCDRVLLVHRGRMLAQGTVAEVCALASARTLTEAFLKLVSEGEGEVRR